jgi:hypothetical protein
MKIVIVLDRELPLGVAVNAAAALAFSVSPSIPSCVGSEVLDASGMPHPGITNVPLPILASTAASLAELRERAGDEGLVACVDFSDRAQRAKNYADYAASLAATPESDLRYLGLCIYGEDQAVRALTGNLPLFGR